MRSIMWPETPLVVGPIDRLHYADSVRQVVGEHALRAGDNHGAIGELGRRLLLRLHTGEAVYAACTLDLPDRGPAVIMATDRRLLASAGFWGDHWNLDAPWERVGGARVTVTGIHVIYELLVDGVRIRLTGQPQHGAAPLVALTAHVLAARPTIFDWRQPPRRHDSRTPTPAWRTATPGGNDRATSLVTSPERVVNAEPTGRR